MAIIRYEPLGLLSQLQKELAHSFSHFGNEFSEGLLSNAEWMPAVDVKEEGNQFVIHADIPGVKPEDIEVNLEAGILTIKGEKKSESKTEKEGYTRVERTQGSFYRRFSLPGASADSEAVVAKFKNGVLELTIPKHEAEKPKRITISTEE
ncbi:MAG: Hsp20/alpha crystallin family protein [Methylococcales bacterium]|nr:Hsp20/alpha crystallin family protein [Methylococcales bacterium]MDD5753618.1 Hsp20/alpha crystallin family protein [Methylococcales bacterium]